MRHIKRRKYTDKEVRYVAEHIVDAEIERVTKIEQEQADQKKFIGNAVEVTIARAWCEALCARLYSRQP